MIEWTDAARAELERCLNDTRSKLRGSSEEIAETLDDIRRHVDEEIHLSGITLISQEDVLRIVKRLAVSTAETAPPPEKQPAPVSANIARRPWLDALNHFFLYALGIFLPIVAFLIETFTQVTADSVGFDPLPTWNHVAITGMVPLSTLYLLKAAKSRDIEYFKVLGFLNGSAIAVSAFLTLLYLPLMAFGAMVFWLGIGLLPMTPLFSLIAAGIARRRYSAMVRTELGRAPGGLWYGIAAVVVLLAVFEMPAAVTTLGMQWAASDDPVMSRRGIGLLRNYGDEEEMIRRCYFQTTTRSTFAFLLESPVGSEAARTIYYRVTGSLFNSRPMPLSGSTRRLPWSNHANWRDWNFDEDQGTSEVGGQRSGLSLASSRIDGSVDPDAAIGYSEWTMIFSNRTQMQQEARTQILLPAGSVVSRVTLWVDGEEREAAFASRGKVKAAYQAVVAQRRDPLLVTTRGRDRILVQCFPVPSNDEMKIRIGFTSPLQISEPGLTLLQLPVLMENNFSVSKDLVHSIWFESKEKIEAPESFKTEIASDSGKPINAVRADLPDQKLSAATLRFHRNPAMRTTWSADLFDTRSVVVQILTEKEIPSPRRVILVLDGSASMAGARDNIAKWISTVPITGNLTILIASDDVQDLGTIAWSDKDAVARMAASVRAFAFIGGRDNVPALIRAWDLAVEAENAQVVWVHGPQPIALGSSDPLMQRWERRPSRAPLLAISIAGGPNRILEDLDGRPEVAVSNGLDELAEKWRAKMAWIRDIRRESLANIPGDAKQTANHLVRLWARDEIQRNSSPAMRDTAVMLAAKYHLVTSVSGAVVLENQAQYDQAGLNPVDPATVPTIPEPETWALIAVALIVALFALRRRQATVAPSPCELRRARSE